VSYRIVLAITASKKFSPNGRSTKSFHRTADRQAAKTVTKAFQCHLIGFIRAAILMTTSGRAAFPTQMQSAVL
jgi:hypothetical protein